MTRRRFALERLLENRIPRAYMHMEPGNTLTESSTGSLNLSDLFPPKENLATAVLAVAIHGIGEFQKRFIFFQDIHLYAIVNLQR